MDIISIEYYQDYARYSNCRIVTDLGTVELASAALKLRLVFGGYVFIGEDSPFAAHRIILPEKWIGNDSQMILRGFCVEPAIVAVAQRFVTDCHMGTFRPGLVPVPTDPPVYINITSPPPEYYPAAIWPLEGATTMGSRLRNNPSLPAGSLTEEED